MFRPLALVAILVLAPPVSADDKDWTGKSIRLKEDVKLGSKLGGGLVRDGATLQQPTVAGQQDALFRQADLNQCLVVGISRPQHVEPEHSKQPRQPTDVHVDDKARIAKRHRP